MFKIGISYKTFVDRGGECTRRGEEKREKRHRAVDDVEGGAGRGEQNERERKKKRDAIYYSVANSVRLGENILSSTYIDGTATFVVNDCNEPKLFMREINAERARSALRYRFDKL